VHAGHAAGRALGLDEAELREIYYVALLRSSGCTADALMTARVFGDEIVARGWLATVDFGSPVAALTGLARHGGPLGDAEWERVRLHPYFTERVLARVEGLGLAGAAAAGHHERLDGSGYHRRLPAAMLPPAHRLLAAADAYHAMTEPRPHQPALAPARAAEELRAEVRRGRLDGDAAEAVLDAAGHAARVRRRAWPAGLTAREIEVLRLVVRGHSNRRIAPELVVSPATVDHHVRHIYAKADVSTRAGATLFAMQHGLVEAQA
jgi:DNA-binding CsgD family transcriptional regulator